MGGRNLSGLYPLEFAWRRVLVVATLQAMSLAVHAGWYVTDAGPGKAGCLLETEKVSLFDGYADTRLRLSVADGAVRVKTESNIDSSFDDLGLMVDGKDFVPADAVVDEKDVLFNTATGSLIEQFIRGRTVTLYLRFWPTYPATQRYESRISLAGFTRAYNDYEACNSKQPS
jgi:hypothetical protein